MNGMVKSTACSRSYVIVRSAIATSARCVDERVAVRPGVVRVTRQRLDVNALTAIEVMQCLSEQVHRIVHKRRLCLQEKRRVYGVTEIFAMVGGSLDQVVPVQVQRSDK
ncbi:hypothetical protein FOCC_FOCC011233, partial [Frankliniella occidentalis]